MIAFTIEEKNPLNSGLASSIIYWNCVRSNSNLVDSRHCLLYNTLVNALIFDANVESSFEAK